MADCIPHAEGDASYADLVTSSTGVYHTYSMQTCDATLSLTDDYNTYEDGTDQPHQPFEDYMSLTESRTVKESGESTELFTNSSAENMSEDQSATYSADNMLYDEYSADQHLSSPGNPNSSVLHSLDVLLRDKVNLEIEEMKSNLHEILDNQCHLVKNLLKMSHKTSIGDSQEGTDESPTLAEGGSQFTPVPGTSVPIENHEEMHSRLEYLEEEKNRLVVEEEKNACLIQLFTLTAKISRTLRRKEFRVT